MGLSAKQLETVTKIFVNVGTLSFGGLVVGKFISPNMIPWYAFVSGLVFSVALFCFAVIIAKGENYD